MLSMNLDNKPQAHWLGMPEFQQTKQLPYAQIILRVENAEQLAELSRRLEQPLTPKTKSAWFPFKSHWGAEKKVWVFDES
jgi:hypothetical protein